MSSMATAGNQKYWNAYCFLQVKKTKKTLFTLQWNQNWSIYDQTLICSCIYTHSKIGE